MVGLVEQVGSALAAVEANLPKDFPSTSWDAISKGMRAEAERFLAGVEGL
jgi:serine/threonine-protein kinase HipA